MTYAIAGNVDAGGTNLAQRLSKLFPDHTFTRLVYEAGEEKDEALSACDGVLIAVSLLGRRYPTAGEWERTSSGLPSPTRMISTIKRKSRPTSRSW